MSEEVMDTSAAPEPTTAAPEVQPETLLKGEDSAGVDETPKPEAQEKKQTEQDAKPKAPEKYEFTVPEGMTLDESLVETFVPLAKELDLDQAGAQKLVDAYAARKIQETKDAQAAWAKQQADWATEVKEDKEFGGANLESTLKASNAAFSKFFTKEEIAQIKDLGLANFTPLVKGLARAGKLMAEDKFHQGGTTPQTRTYEEVLYGSTNT